MPARIPPRILAQYVLPTAKTTDLTLNQADEKLIHHLKKYIPTKNAARRCFAYVRMLVSLDYTAKNVFLIIGGVIFAIGAGIPFPLLGIVFGELINDMNSVTCDSSQGSGANLSDSVRRKVLYIIYITMGNFCCLYIHSVCWCLVSERVARRYRRHYFESVIRQETSFIESLPSGDVFSRLVSDIEVMQTETSEKVGLVITSISYFVTAYIIAFVKVKVIAGMLVSVLPCYFFVAFAGAHYIKKYAARIAESANAATIQVIRWS